jgi:hypothetical protein
MAIACFGSVTFLPDLPERSTPSFISCMDRSTFLPARGLYSRAEALLGLRPAAACPGAARRRDFDAVLRTTGARLRVVLDLPLETFADVWRLALAVFALLVPGNVFCVSFSVRERSAGVRVPTVDFDCAFFFAAFGMCSVQQTLCHPKRLLITTRAIPEGLTRCSSTKSGTD